MFYYTTEFVCMVSLANRLNRDLLVCGYTHILICCGGLKLTALQHSVSKTSGYECMWSCGEFASAQARLLSYKECYIFYFLNKETFFFW
jgi:hypothetical protein